jgi:hypothetical protein
MIRTHALVSSQARDQTPPQVRFLSVTRYLPPIPHSNPSAVVAGGKLEDGWVVQGTMRNTGVNSGRLDMLYISPDQQRFRSQNQVLYHLGLQRPASADGAASAQPKLHASQDKDFDPAKARGAKIQARVGIAGAFLSHL